MQNNGHIKDSQKKARAKRIAFNFKRLREACGWTQIQAAEKLGVNRSYIGRIETGNAGFGPNAQEKWARVFGVDMIEFFKPITGEGARPATTGEAYMRIPVNPKMPMNFDCTPNEARPVSHRRWWNRPYIQTFTLEDFGNSDEESKRRWLEAWPAGTRYDLRCLDGLAWDRSTCHGSFKTLEEAKEAGRQLAAMVRNKSNIRGSF